MTMSARLEIYQINVGQGDSTLIVNRRLDKVSDAIKKAKGMGVLGGLEPIDYVPYAVANDIDLDGTIERALLVDGGDDVYGDDVLNYIKKLGALRTDPKPYCPELYLLVSHYHDDHMAGLRYVFKERVDTPPPKKKKKGKKASPVSVKERYRPARVYQTAKNPKADPKTFRFAAFTKDVDDAYLTPPMTERYYIDPGGFQAGTKNITTIDLGTGVDNIPIQLFVLAAAQGVYKAFGKYTPIDPVSKNVFDQNDRSVVLILQYGSFRYFLGGDIAGNGGPDGGNTGNNAADTGAKRFFSVHADVESTLGPALEAYFPRTPQSGWVANSPKFTSAGYCTVLKADHHGSSSSVDVHLLSTVRPCIAVIGSGIKARFHNHPTKQVIDRMSSSTTPRWGLREGGDVGNTIKQVYATEVAQKVKGKTFNVDLRGARIFGDIVVRPVDETIQAIQAATTKGTALNVQVYGTGEQSVFADSDTTLRSLTEAKKAAGSTYPLGPYYHSDVH
jgi:beta-lactamase superfamily II metal-dependent hydrolase